MAVVDFAKWLPVPNHSGPMSAHNGLVLHVQAGNNSCYGLFSNPSYQASATWWVGKDGTLEQYVDSDQVAWAQMSGNATWNSVETEGVPTEPLTDAQISTLAKLYAWGMATYRWPKIIAEDVNGRGFGWHGMGGADWGGHTGCPGDLRKAQRQQILDLASPVVPTPPKDINMAVSPVISSFKPGRLDVFQVSSNTLWHKANIGGVWTNEGVAGPSGGTSKVSATFPDQVPQAAVSNGQLTVMVEDSRGFAFYFATSGNGWGAAQLP